MSLDNAEKVDDKAEYKMDLSSEIKELALRYDDQRLSLIMNKMCQNLRAKYLEYPMLVHLETQAVCNANCTFCPYDSMERKGVKMSDQLIEKVIDDLSDMPKDLFYTINPYKVSEPFLEPRLFDILDLMINRLPGAKISFISNGAALTEKKLDNLAKLDASRFSALKISLNSLDPQEYESTMRIPLHKTLKRLDVLHEYIARGKLSIPVNITRVAFDVESDLKFILEVKRRYPLFSLYVIRRNDWIGSVKIEKPHEHVPDTPCKRWFDLSITATGKVALCCMDSEAKYTYGDVNNEHVLDIYRKSQMELLRLLLPSRKDADSPCNQCTYLN